MQPGGSRRRPIRMADLHALRRRLRGACALVPAAVVAAGALLAACTPASAGDGHSPPQRHAPAATTSPPPSGLLPASPQLTDRLILTSTKVTAGARIAGTLLVINHGRKPVNLNHGCGPKFAVVLIGPRYQPQVAFTSDCSVRPFIMRPGVNRIRFTLLTTYLVCAARAHLVNGEHTCGKDGTMPPLPAGRYRAVLVGSGLPLPAPEPVTVTLR